MATENTIATTDMTTELSGFPPETPPADMSQSALETLASAATDCLQDNHPDVEPANTGDGQRVRAGGSTACPNPEGCSMLEHRNHQVSYEVPRRPLPSFASFVNHDPQALSEPTSSDHPQKLGNIETGLTQNRPNTQYIDLTGEDDNDEVQVQQQQKPVAVSGSRLRFPSNTTIQGLGCISTSREGWECQHVAPGAAQNCGTICESGRDLVGHYSASHAAVEMLLPSYWHPCDNCVAYNRTYDFCRQCGTPSRYAASRWLLGFTGNEPGRPGDVVVGVAPANVATITDTHGGDEEGLFGIVTPEQYEDVGLATMLYGTLQPIFSGEDGNFIRQFYSPDSATPPHAGSL